MSPPSSDRSTADLVILFLTGLLGVVVLVSVVGIVVVELWTPQRDTTAVAVAIGHVVNVLLGVIVGYLAGRNRRNGNGS